MKLINVIKYFFVSLYVLYAISPLIGGVNEASIGFTNDKTYAGIRILFVEKILSAVLDEQDAVEPDNSGDGSDFLVKRFRLLPGGNSLGKRLSIESRIAAADLLLTPDLTGTEQTNLFHSISRDIVPGPFLKGYGTIHSGLAPPCILS